MYKMHGLDWVMELVPDQPVQCSVGESGSCGPCGEGDNNRFQLRFLQTVQMPKIMSKEDPFDTKVADLLVYGSSFEFLELAEGRVQIVFSAKPIRKE